MDSATWDVCDDVVSHAGFWASAVVRFSYDCNFKFKQSSATRARDFGKEQTVPAFEAGSALVHGLGLRFLVFGLFFLGFRGLGL